MKFPEDVLYTEDHEWIKFDGETAIVGITDFAQKELGDIVFVEIDTLGNELKTGAIFGTIEAVKTVSDLFLPVAGTVLEINPKINEVPELVNKDPYGEGWLIKIRIENRKEQQTLLSPLEYIKLI